MRPISLDSQLFDEGKAKAGWQVGRGEKEGRRGGRRREEEEGERQVGS